MPGVRRARRLRRTCAVTQRLRWRGVARRTEGQAPGHAGSAALVASERDHGAGWWRAERGRTSRGDGLTASGACMGARQTWRARRDRGCGPRRGAGPDAQIAYVRGGSAGREREDVGCARRRARRHGGRRGSDVRAVATTTTTTSTTRRTARCGRTAASRTSVSYEFVA